MSAKNILIIDADATAALKALGTVVPMAYIKIPVANEEDAQDILDTIDEEKWCASATTEETNGNTVRGIRLPKEAITG